MASQWDKFVRECRSPHFFFQRGYMDYHSDRFVDHSLVFARDEQWLAVLPACEAQGILHSHQGLTYGGLLGTRKLTQSVVLQIFRVMAEHLTESALEAVMYKALPSIYFEVPAQDDLYALTRMGASLVRREASSMLRIEQQREGYTKGKKHSLSLARRAGLTVSRSDKWQEFMALLTTVLDERHETRPVHTQSELKLLVDRFPDHIQLYVAELGSELLAGTVVFVNETVVHTQYMASSDKGRECGALDAIVDDLICTAFRTKQTLSFGVSTERAGADLNAGLIQSKEAYGARTLVHDTYLLKAEAAKLERDA